MNYYKAIIQYDGTGRMGFMQLQGLSTIQGDLNNSLQKILRGEYLTRAASRTDKGVHAFAQVIKIATEDSSPLDVASLNEVLPSHIRCLDITNCEADFIPSIDQHSKEYCYLFTNEPEDSENPYIANTPVPLNIVHIQTCINMLKGTNNFQNFWTKTGTSNTTLREILHCELTQIDPREFFKDSIFTAGTATTCWQFRIIGSGFLRHMLRHLVGALWLVGSGRLTVEDFSHYLLGELKHQRPWKKADPRGLYLRRVHY